MTSGGYCAIPGCYDPGQHQTACTAEGCRGCVPQLCETGHVCHGHRHRLTADLTDIPDLDRELRAGQDPADRTEWTVRQQRPVPTTDSRRLPAWTWASQAGRDPVSRRLPMGIIPSRRTGGTVTGSRTPPTPLGDRGIDRADLTGPARPGSIGVRYRGRWSQTGGDPDQVGYLSVATELDFWVQDWTGHRALGEHLPPPTVAALAGWLETRLDWACDHHLGIDEFAGKIGQIRAALRAMLELNPPRRELLHAVRCKSCDRAALYREEGYVQCGQCGMYYSERDYEEWTRRLAAEAKGVAA